MSVEGGRSSSFLTASATVPVSRSPTWPPFPSPPVEPSVRNPMRGTDSRSCLNPRVPKGERIMHEAAQHRVGCGQVRVAKAAPSIAAGTEISESLCTGQARLGISVVFHDLSSCPFRTGPAGLYRKKERIWNGQ